MPKLAAVASFLFTRLSRWLVRHNGSRYVLAGTFALAGLGAYAANRPPAHSATVTSTPSAAAVTERHFGHHGWRHHYHGYGGYGYGGYGHGGYGYGGYGGYIYSGQAGTRHIESPYNNYDYYVGHGTDLGSTTATQ